MPTTGFYAPVIGIFDRQKKSGEKMTITGDGEQRRDFIYVKDIVSGILASAWGKRDLVAGKIFNLGSGTNYSINQIAEMMGGEFAYIPARTGDAQETLADISRVQRALDWRPQVELHKWIKDLNDSY